MTVKQWSIENETAPVVNVYLFVGEDDDNNGESYWVIDIDTSPNVTIDDLKVYVNDGELKVEL